ncbi:MAG TPA: aspartate--tRNA ligase, partial [Candidatus Nanoarchaeia archaeon]|nr:aspartate--tRNA ligase [Candidatus Nanoarchaeia archaeon]
MKTKYRTHTCGQLEKTDINKEITLAGWVQARRDHGGLIFIDLRDRYGLTQIVFNPDFKDFKLAESLRREYCIQIKGKVKARPIGMINQDLSTGEIEIEVKELNLLNKSEVPPFEIDERIEINEDLRLKYRYLDLRRKNMLKNLELRYRMTQIVRNYLDKHNFIDVETPCLTKSTPEGARDYLVPSRVNPQNFYALPQSPQLFKQILMISGYDRYYQIVRCFRDEDLRADRQPEFTQIDIEMAFIEEEDIQNIVEGIMKELFKEFKNKNLKLPLKRISFHQAIETYGSDKPDLRFNLELIDVDEIVKKSDFNIFKTSELVKAISLEKEISRKDLDEITGWAMRNGAMGLAWIKVSDEKYDGAVVKYFKEKELKELVKKLKLKNGVIFFVADKRKTVNEVLGRLREHLAEKYKLIDENKDELFWVVDFPLFEYSEDEQRWVSVHHPFTQPYPDQVKKMVTDPGNVRSRGYDLVWNGNEIAGGSIRIHGQEMQSDVFKSLGISEEEAKIK